MFITEKFALKFAWSLPKSKTLFFNLPGADRLDYTHIRHVGEVAVKAGDYSDDKPPGRCTLQRVKVDTLTHQSCPSSSCVVLRDVLGPRSPQCRGFETNEFLRGKYTGTLPNLQKGGPGSFFWGGGGNSLKSPPKGVALPEGRLPTIISDTPHKACCAQSPTSLSHCAPCTVNKALVKGEGWLTTTGVPVWRIRISMSAVSSTTDELTKCCSETAIEQLELVCDWTVTKWHCVTVSLANYKAPGKETHKNIICCKF